MLSTLTGFFARHPLVANSVLYGTLLVGAEFSQQTISKKVMVIIQINQLYNIDGSRI